MIKKILILLITISLLAGCQTPQNEINEVTEEERVIHIELATAPVGLHPLKTNDQSSFWLISQIYETLYRRKADGTGYEPLLAEDFPELSENGLQATIHLKQGIKFQNGDDFNAESVQYMIKALKNRKYGSQHPSLASSINSCNVIDDYTIRLNLKHKDSSLVACLANVSASIFNQILDEDEEQDLLLNPSGAGTGPYVFASANAGTSYILEANPSYWGGQPEFQKIQFDVVPDEETALKRLESGEADIYPQVDPAYQEELDQYETVSSVYKSRNLVYYIGMRSDKTAKNPLMADTKFRTMICSSVCFDPFIGERFDSDVTRISTVIPSTVAGYDPVMETYNMLLDRDSAKNIIRENGWLGETITFLCPNEREFLDIGEYIKNELGMVGLNVEIIAEELSEYQNDTKEKGTFDMALLSYSTQSGDGSKILNDTFLSGANVRLRLADSELDRQINIASRSNDDQEKQEALNKAVSILAEDCVIIPLYSPNTYYAYSSDLENVVFYENGMFYLNDMSLKGEINETGESDN